jgi:hypothetical protein
MGKTTGGSVQTVQVEDDEGNIEVFTSQEEIQEAIWNNIHRKRFHLAEAAPICNSPLREIFGYNANTEAGEDVLAGTYDFDPEFDDATKRICEEVASIRATIPRDSVNTIIRRGEWSNFWSKAREETSSSESGLHFSHYKAGANSPLISHFHATKVSVMLKSGWGYERWGRGLSVMLEKTPGCHLVSKLRSILLMEADFNCANKIVFGNRMLANVRRYGFMPDEIFSERNRTAGEGTMAKVLFYDVVRQTRLSAGISSVDADNCYDRVSHAIASLVFRSFGTPQAATTAMLRTIQDMKFFLRTSFGDSRNCAGSVIDVKTQGLCQGNGAAPAGWAVVSIVILNAHKKAGHGATFLCPMSLIRNNLAAVLFVDDTDVIHLDMTRVEDEYEVLNGLQRSVTSWGNLLIATGGSLKPSKCFYHIISFSWKADGTWVYDKNEDKEDLQLYIPLPNNEMAPIQHCGVDEAHKTLGMMTCPSGAQESVITHMKERAQGWIDQATAAHLTSRNLWFLLKVQFSPKVLYSIGACSAPYATLAECLMKQYYKLVPLGGVRRSACRMVRQLDRGFYGVGCPHPAVECLAAQTTTILTHYGCETAVGRLLQVSVELLILELGMGGQPFQADFALCGEWVTDSWVKSLWEKCFLFGITLEEGKLHILPPRERDEWLMPLLCKMNFTRAERVRLNRVRMYQEVLFLSDVMDARGNCIDKRYEARRLESDHWSKFRFPRQCPSDSDFRLWKRAIYQLRYIRSSPTLGRFLRDGHKLWEWRYCEESNRLLKYNGGEMDIYTPSELPRYINRPNCWTRSRINQVAVRHGVICSVAPVSLAVWKITSHAPPEQVETQPQSLQEVFEKWGCSWLWKDLKWQGDDDWLKESIQQEDCIVVADGSYMPDLRKDLCATAFFFECRAGRGRLVGSFADFNVASNAYRGELLGLMAVHLVLAGIASLHPNLSGKVVIYSDCDGALGKIANLPPLRLPGRCKHSDILKNILIHCSNLPFELEMVHIAAHQDEQEDFHKLSRPAQLNCAVDAGAKKKLLEANAMAFPGPRQFPLEPIACFVGKNKMTSDTSEAIRFWAHRRLAREAMVDGKVLYGRQFDLIAWEAVYEALRSVPQMFQLWACKQVWDIAGTNYLRSKWDKSVKRWCPSCRRAKETAAHVVSCSEFGRVDTLHKTVDFVVEWLAEIGTHSTLQTCIAQYAHGRGYLSMKEVCRELGQQFQEMAIDQDEIGWRRFMEGMLAKKMVCIQEDYHDYTGEGIAGLAWARQLVVRLLEVTHGQWIYRNIQVHDEHQGTIRTAEKEVLQREIEEELRLGFNGFLDMDKPLAEVTLEDLERCGGERQEYWLLAVKAARVAKALTDSNAAVDTQPD